MTPFPSRWPAGTLAAAGTTPARTIEVSPTLVISQGHHPAKHRSAIPTRAYESGSCHGHDAAPAGHPHPPRPPPRPRHPSPPMPAPPSWCARQPASRAPAASLRERYAPLDPGQPAHTNRRLSGHGPTPACPQPPRQTSPKTAQTTETPAHHLQKLDEPLHMSAYVGRPRFSVAGSARGSAQRQIQQYRRSPRRPAWRARSASSSSKIARLPGSPRSRNSSVSDHGAATAMI